MKKLLIFAICTFTVSLCFSQVPGYMGKKIHLQGGAKFFLAAFNFVNVTQSDDFHTPYYGFNIRYELGMDFMISRKSSLGFNFHYFSSAMKTYMIDSTTYEPNYGRVAIDGGAFGAVFKTYFGNWVAPVGPYYRGELGAIIYNTRDVRNHYNGAFPETTLATAYMINGIGRTHIFANVISLDYGGEIGLVFPPWSSSGSLGNDYQPIDGTGYRMMRSYFFNVYLKVGVVF